MLTPALPDLRTGAAERPLRRTDDDFVRELFIRDRLPEFLVGGVAEPAARTLLTDQFRLQTASYRTDHPEAEHLVLLHGGIPVGRCTVDRAADPVVLVDLLVDEDHRSRGIATAAVRRIQHQARTAGAAVELSVVPGTPAQRLYERLGFVVCGSSATRLRMRWSSR